MLRTSRSLKLRSASLLLANGLLLGVIALLLKEGASFGDVLRRAASNVAPTALAAIGLSGILFAGAIDLSIGTIIAVAATIFGILVHWGLPPLCCHAGCFAVAWGLSMLNGLLVRVLRIPAIIFDACRPHLLPGRGAHPRRRGHSRFQRQHFHHSIHDEAYHGPGKHYAGWILLGVLAGAFCWEACAATPRRWLALGSSREACRLQGLEPERVLLSSFFVGGIFLGFAALIKTAQAQAIEPARMALGFELPVIGAVVLGGANIFGGEGAYAGAVLGAFFLHFTQEVLICAGVSAYWRDVAIGGILLLVIGLDCLFHRRRKLLEELR